LPLLLVTADRVPCRAGLVAVQVTPGSAAPELSVTVPVISPVVWANTRPPAAALTTTIASHGTKNLRNLIELLLCCLRRWTGLSLSQSLESRDERDKSTDTSAFQEQSNCQ
jgi:hypothetical protein